jgi:hypothetical protein
MIEVGTPVIFNTFEGEFTGIVLSIRDTTLAELNPEQPANPNKPLAQETIPTVNTKRLITLYTIQVDENPQYTGPNPLETPAFVREQT